MMKGLLPGAWCWNGETSQRREAPIGMCVYIYINFIDFLTVLYIHDKAILGDRMKYPELDNS